MIEHLILLILKVKPYVELLMMTLCAMKVFLFVIKRKSTWKMYHFFYFDNTHLILSHSQNSYNNKKMQNNLTLIIIALLGLQILNTIVANMVVYTG